MGRQVSTDEKSTKRLRRVLHTEKHLLENLQGEQHQDAQAFFYGASYLISVEYF